MQKIKSDLIDAKITDWNLYNLQTVFGERTSVTDLEMFEYQSGKILIMLHSANLDLNDLGAQEEVIEVLDIEETYINSLKSLLVLVMVSKLKEIFTGNK